MPSYQQIVSTVSFGLQKCPPPPQNQLIWLNKASPLTELGCQTFVCVCVGVWGCGGCVCVCVQKKNKIMFHHFWMNFIGYLSKKNILKIILFDFKCLSDIGPLYLASILSFNISARVGLRSSPDFTRLHKHNIYPRTLQPNCSLNNYCAKNYTTRLVKLVFLTNIV